VINARGEPVWVLISAAQIEYNGKPATLALLANINNLKVLEKEREKLIGDLQDALADVKTLSGLIPICSHCKKIRNDTGFWDRVEIYLTKRSDAIFSHGICPECAKDWVTEAGLPWDPRLLE
jgi:hypothetical protein